MSHVRKQIRDAAVAALSSIGGVYATRTVPFEAQELPVVLVYTNDEEIARSTMSGYQRTVDLVVEAIARGRSVDDELDALLVRIETALNASKLGGLSKPLAPTTLGITIEADGETPIGRARLTYRAVYCTDHTAPETAI